MGLKQWVFGEKVTAGDLNANFEKSLNAIAIILAFGGSSAPDGFLMCDGSAVNRNTYAELFAVIGETYGVGDGSTTFNLPDLQGRVPVGKDGATFTNEGDEGGEEEHTLTSAESGVPAHDHPIGISNGYGGTSRVAGSNSGSDATTHNSNDNTAENASSAHNNLQPYLVINYIIKF